MEPAKSAGRRVGFRLLIVAAAFHLAVAGTVQLVGWRAALPDLFDRHGVIQGTDSQEHRAEALALAGELSRRDLAAWGSYGAQPHVKLYSVAFALFGPWLGDGILGAEPLNLAYYLVTLTLVFWLGQELGGRTVGLVAAAAVAVWPSFLLHATQFLRDPLYVPALLLLVLVLSSWLPRAASGWQGALTGALGAIAGAVLWAVRGQMWEVTVGAVLLGLGLMVFWQLCRKRLAGASLLGGAILVAVLACVPRFIPTTRHTDAELAEAFPQAGAEAGPGTKAAPASPAEPTPQEGAAPPFHGLARRVADVRKLLALSYPTAGSNVDTEVEFADAADVLRYLPRALALGWFAPFPGMWLGEGRELGAAGRRLSGLETLGIYVISPVALVSLRRWRRLALWQLWGIALVGMTALGLVAVNIGYLYRARYCFWILLVILAADGAFQARGLLPNRRPGWGSPSGKNSHT
jgi:hypothetical protein